MRLLFYVAKRYSIPVVLPIVRLCENRSVPFALFLSRRVLEAMPDEWRGAPVFDNRREAAAFHPDFVLSPGNFVDFRLPGVKVQIFHGLGVEKESHYRIRHFFDIYCTSGPMVTRRFQRLRKRYGYFMVEETGWPKMDYILGYDTSGLRERWNIPPKKRVVLYAPTFSSGMESATDLIPVLPNAVRNDEIWLVKLHELAPPRLVEGAKALEGIEGIRMVETDDVTPLLHLADALVSDTSSVVYEFMALDRPAVTYRSRGRKGKALDITEPRQLRSALDEALEGAAAAGGVASLAEVNPHLDQRCSNRVLDLLGRVHGNPSLLPKRRKPLNLVRKLQVVWHERFRKGYLR